MNKATLQQTSQSNQAGKVPKKKFRGGEQEEEVRKPPKQAWDAASRGSRAS
jgi:hypothetical protein